MQRPVMMTCTIALSLFVSVMAQDSRQTPVDPGSPSASVPKEASRRKLSSGSL
jgi:hypothetical protein